MSNPYLALSGKVLGHLLQPVSLVHRVLFAHVVKPLEVQYDLVAVPPHCRADSLTGLDRVSDHVAHFAQLVIEEVNELFLSVRVQVSHDIQPLFFELEEKESG